MKSLAAVVLDSVELALRVDGDTNADGLGTRVEHDLAVARGFVPELNQLCIGVVAPCLQYVLAAGRDIGRVVVPVLWAMAELIGADQLVCSILSQAIECTIGANRAQAVCLADGTGRFTRPKLPKELDASAGATPTRRATAAASAGATNFLAEK